MTYTNRTKMSALALATIVIMLLAPASGIQRDAAASQSGTTPIFPGIAAGSCKLDKQVTDPISQSAVATANLNQVLVKHAEKRLFYCNESGNAVLFKFDVTLFQNLVVTGSSPDNVKVKFSQTTCAVNEKTPSKICQTNPVGQSTVNTGVDTASCVKVFLASPQRMNTLLALPAISSTPTIYKVESQKEIFTCGHFLEDMVVWQITADNVDSTGADTSTTNWMVTDCTTDLNDASQGTISHPSTNCDSTKAKLLIA